MKTLLSIGEVSERLGLSVDSVRQLEDSGELPAERTAGGHRRFKAAVVEAFQQQRVQRRGSRNAPPSVARSPAKGWRPTSKAKRRPAPLDTWLERIEEGEPEEFDTFPAQAQPKVDPAPSPPTHDWAKQLLETNQRAAEDGRLRSLKAHGESRIPFLASASARSAVIESLEAYVTSTRFPDSMSPSDARRAIEAKVAAVLEPYERAETQAAEAATAAKAEKARKESRVLELIARGMSRVRSATSSWDWEDRGEARSEVENALRDEIKPDWSERDVDQLVDEILDDWDDEADEEED